MTRIDLVRIGTAYRFVKIEMGRREDLLPMQLLIAIAQVLWANPRG